MKKKSNFFKSLLCLICISTVFFILSCTHQTAEETKYTVSYHSLRAETDVPAAISVSYGTVLMSENLPALYEEGCVFNGWYDGEILAKAGEYKVTRNVILEAGWTKIRTDGTGETGLETIYTVEHYFQKLKSAGYSLVENDTQTVTGKSGDTTDAKALAVTGFTAKSIDQQIIASDGSTVVQVYYDRNTIIVSFDTDGGNEIAPISGFYGAELTAPENPEKDGFEFNGWYPELTSKFERNVTVKALWKGNSTNVDFVITQSDIAISVDRTCVTAAEGYSDYLWSVNGSFSNEKTNQLYVPCKSGLYEVNVTALKGGTAYSASVTMTISSENTDGDFVKVTGATVTKNTTENKEAFTYFADGYSKKLAAFYICSHEVTQAEYYEIMNANPSVNIANAEITEIQENRPVENVTWYMAIAYCNARSDAENLQPCYKINGKTDFWKSSIPTADDADWDEAACDISMNGYRLPTEAEWEYAARGGEYGLEADQFTYSGSNTAVDAAWYADNSNSKTHEKCSKKTNRLGLYDMSGNVAEWCNDAFSKVVSDDDSGSINRVCRGGGYTDSAENCEISYRNSYAPYIKNGSKGFRLVRSSL